MRRRFLSLAIRLAVALGTAVVTARAAEVTDAATAGKEIAPLIIGNDLSDCGHDHPAGRTALDGLTVEQVADARRDCVNRHSTLGIFPPDYHPLKGERAGIYTGIVSGKGWTATAPYYVTNPYVLVTLAAANLVTPLNVVSPDVALSVTKGRFEERRTGAAATALLNALFSDQFDQPGKVRLMNVNAYDAGFRFASVDPSASENVAPEPGTHSIYGSVYTRACFYHVGRYGKNNLSPEDRDAWLVIKDRHVATRIVVKLWREKPASPEAVQDLIYQCIIDPASPAAAPSGR